MRIPSGVTDQYIYFVAVDATDLKTRETGLSGFTVYRSRNGGAAASYTTPTINETDTTNMPGVYELLLDEDMTIDSGDDSQEVVLHITHASMAPVTRTFELYRPKITAGNTLDVTAAGEAGLDFNNVALPDGPIPALGIVEGGTAQSATSTTLVGRAAGAVADDAFNNCLLLAFGSTQGYWQAAIIADTTLSNDTFTVAAWPAATPSGTITYRIFGVAGSAALDAAGIRSAVGLASANLDTQLADLPTVSEFNARTLAAASYFDPTTDAVTLANGAHGGAAFTLTGKSIAITNSDAGGIAVDLVGSGTGNSHALRLQSTNGHGLAAGSTNGNAINAASTSADAVSIAGGTNSDGLQIAGNGTGVDIRANITGNITGTLSELSSAIADSIPADGTIPSVKQALYMLTQFMLERSISGTTCTVAKADGTTALFTLTLNDATTPTSVTRAT